MDISTFSFGDLALQTNILVSVNTIGLTGQCELDRTGNQRRWESRRFHELRF